MEVLSFSKGERLIQSKGERLIQVIVTHADTTEEALTKAKKKKRGNLWIESVDAPATRTKPGKYREVHYVEVLKHSE